MNQTTSKLHRKTVFFITCLMVIFFSLMPLWPSKRACFGTILASAQTTKKSYILITNKVTELELNATKTFKVKNVNLTSTNYVWSSSNTKVAKVSKSGVVTTLSAGKVTIKVKDRTSGKTSSCTFRVRPAAAAESDFTYTAKNGKITITGYQPSKKVTKLVVPASIEGLPVTAVGSYAFYQTASVKTLDLPYGITSIGEFAFYGCKSLTRITIPSTVKVFETGAFASCTSLNQVSLPAKVTTLGDNLFNNCKALTSIKLPDSCTNLGEKLLSATPLQSLSNLQLYLETGSDLLLTSEDQKVYKKITSVIKKLDLDSDLPVEKVKKVHDWMIMNCTYDTRLYDASMPEESYTAYGFMMNGTAVCSGYAETFQLFMHLLGIECNYITGTGKGVSHAWNSVKLGEDWYQIDTTWDDPLPETNSLNYHYFLLTDNEMSKDHTWTKANYPAASGTRYKYYAYEDYICQDAAAIRKSIQKQKKDGSEWITILCPESITIKTYIFEFTSSYTMRSPYQCGDYKVYMFQMK